MKFGPLDSFSCFKFENTLGTLKDLVTSTKAPLKSFGNNMRNRSTFVSKATRSFLNYAGKPVLRGPILLEDTETTDLGGQAYKSVCYQNLYLSVAKPDCFYATSRTEIFCLTKIVLAAGGSVSLFGRQFDNIKPAYYINTDTSTVFESSVLGVYRLIKSVHEDEKESKCMDIETVKYKCVVHDLDGQSYCYPLLSLK
jgi:hypothetical protein